MLLIESEFYLSAAATKRYEYTHEDYNKSWEIALQMHHHVQDAQQRKESSSSGGKKLRQRLGTLPCLLEGEGGGGSFCNFGEFCTLCYHLIMTPMTLLF